MKTVIIIIALVAIASVGVFAFQNVPKAKPEATPNNSKMMAKETIPTETQTETVSTNTAYLAYSPATYDANTTKRRVLFFHAGWCPSCKAADQDINANMDSIPNDVVILKTDYDTEKELKAKYGITYQHTFVLVDAEGNQITKWNGGGFNEIISKLN